MIGNLFHLGGKAILALSMAAFLIPGCSRADDYSHIRAKEKRAQALCELLSSEAFGFPVHRWSYLVPDSIWDGEFAREIVDLGEHSLPYLEPLLNDQTRVVIAGSEYAALSEAYRLRVCDFAFRYWCQIHQLEYKFFIFQEERDRYRNQLVSRVGSPFK